MFNENKIEQVISAIKDNGLSAMDDDSLAKLLSILSPKELENFVSISFERLGGLEASRRIMNILPLTELLVRRDLYRIRKSEIYVYFLESLRSQRYKEFISKLSNEELADLKRYVYYTADNGDKLKMSASKKLIKLFAREISIRDTNRKPHFSTN